MATMSARYTVIDGEVVAQERGGVRHQLVPDPLGSTVALYDDSGTKTDMFGYWPYGENATRTGVTTVNFKFMGNSRFFCCKDGLYYTDGNFLESKITRLLSKSRSYSSKKDYNSFVFQMNNPVTANWEFIPCAPSSPIIIPGIPPEIRPGYGKYCGPQTTPGEGPGVDPVDSCCKNHDDDWRDACPPCGAFNQLWRNDCRKITAQLCDCLKKADCHQYPPGTKKRKECACALLITKGYACGQLSKPIVPWLPWPDLRPGLPRPVTNSYVM